MEMTVILIENSLKDYFFIQGKMFTYKNTVVGEKVLHKFAILLL